MLCISQKNVLNKSCIECFFLGICYCVFFVGLKFLGLWGGKPAFFAHLRKPTPTIYMLGTLFLASVWFLWSVIKEPGLFQI